MQQILAGGLAAVAFTSLAAQFAVSNSLMGQPGWPSVMWAMAGYFTVLTNTLVLWTFIAIAMGSAWAGPGWQGGLTLWISAVGIVYHAVLAQLWQPEGLAWWADQGLHSAVPLLVVLWWFRCAPKDGLGLRHAALWLVWPLLYCVYALVRGQLSGFFPYPFIDLSTLSAGEVMRNIAMLALAFGAGGLVLLAAARVVARW